VWRGSTCGKIARRIPKPSIVAGRIQAVVSLFQKMDPTFVNEKVLKEHRLVLQHIANGCISDPENVVLHFVKPNGSYYIARGNSSLEGYHLHNSSLFTATVERGHYLAMDKNFRWNEARKMEHGLLPHSNCRSPWIRDQIKKMYCKHASLFTCDPLPQYALGVNDWETELETFGCAQLLTSTDIECDTVNTENIQLDIEETDQRDLDADMEDLVAAVMETRLDIVEDDAIPIRFIDSALGVDLGNISLENSLIAPQSVRTAKEIDLFVEIYCRQTNTGPNYSTNLKPKKFNSAKLVGEWNRILSDKIKTSINPITVLSEFSFKTVRHVNNFKKFVELQAQASILLDPHIEEYKRLVRCIQVPSNAEIMKEHILLPKLASSTSVANNTTINVAETLVVDASIDIIGDISRHDTPSVHEVNRVNLPPVVVINF
jgi:hypothetical protein